MPSATGRSSFDGGIRTGADVLRALALGARACLIGRAYVYGLGAGGEAGVAKAIDILRNELDVAMALTGTTSVRDVGRETVSRSLLGDRGELRFAELRAVVVHEQRCTRSARRSSRRTSRPPQERAAAHTTSPISGRIQPTTSAATARRFAPPEYA